MRSSLFIRYLIIVVNSTEERKKIYVSLLAKLYLPDEVDEDKLRKLKLLVSNIRRVRSHFLRASEFI
jgi:hypothetical protein